MTNKSLRDYINLIESNEQGVAEAGNKPLEKSLFGMGDTRTPRDIKSQMSGASDEFVKSTADKTTGPFHSKVAKMQGKMAKSELRKREQGVAEGFFGIDDKIKGKIQNVVSDLSDIPGMWDHKAQTFTDAGMDKLKTVLKNNPKYIKYALNLDYRDYEAEGVAEGAPIVVMPRSDRIKKPEPAKVRYQGNIVPSTQPPSTEKRGVKGRPGQRPMPK